MTVLFVIFLVRSVQNQVSKMDQTWSNWISHQSKYATVKSCQSYKKDKKGWVFCLIFLDQICSKWIKLVQIRFSPIKIVTKGQLISKCPFGFIVWTKIPTKLFLDFCPEFFVASWGLHGSSLGFLGT